jgi:hypothetical protein
MVELMRALRSIFLFVTSTGDGSKKQRKSRFSEAPPIEKPAGPAAATNPVVPLTDFSRLPPQAAAVAQALAKAQVLSPASLMFFFVFFMFSFKASLPPSISHLSLSLYPPRSFPFFYIPKAFGLV